jgi:hypothetical protein
MDRPWVGPHGSNHLQAMQASGHRTRAPKQTAARCMSIRIALTDALWFGESKQNLGGKPQRELDTGALLTMPDLFVVEVNASSAQVLCEVADEAQRRQQARGALSFMNAKCTTLSKMGRAHSKLAVNNATWCTYTRSTYGSRFSWLYSGLPGTVRVMPVLASVQLDPGTYSP